MSTFGEDRLARQLFVEVGVVVVTVVVFVVINTGPKEVGVGRLTQTRVPFGFWFRIQP